MVWKHSLSPDVKKFKQLIGKIMLILFWDVEGVVAVHFTPRGETENSKNYCYMLRTKLNPAVRSKCCVKLKKGVILKQDQARLHSAEHTIDTIIKGWGI